MLMSRMSRRLDLLERDSRRRRRTAVGDHRREAFRAGHVGPLADDDQRRVGTHGQRLEAGELRELLGIKIGIRIRRHRDSNSSPRPELLEPRAPESRVPTYEAPPRRPPRRWPSECARALSRSIHRRCLHTPTTAKSRSSRSFSTGASSYLSERVGQAGVGMAARILANQARQFGHVRAHLTGAEGAVETHAERPRMLDRDVERIQGLAREACGRSRSAIVAEIISGSSRRERRTHRGSPRWQPWRSGCRRRSREEQIDAAVDEPARLLPIGAPNSSERRGAVGRVVDVGRDRQRPVGRSDRARDETRTARRLAGPSVGGLLRAHGRPPRSSRRRRSGSEVGLRNGGAVEGVGLDDVGATSR